MTTPLFVPSPEQVKVIAHRGGHLQVVACAGAGKTEAISRRVSALIEVAQVAPRQQNAQERPQQDGASGFRPLRVHRISSASAGARRPGAGAMGGPVSVGRECSPACRTTSVETGSRGP
jgi:superfamily I DNA/RNA helicase